MKIELVESTGSDRLIASVSRLSRGVEWSRDICKETDQRLEFLFTNKQLTPFEFAGATFYIEASIYVARQIMRYRCASYLERSLRFCEPMKYANTPKPRDLPLSTQTAFYMRATLREWFHIMDERLTPDAQAETRHLVELIRRELLDCFPISIGLWDKFGGMYNNRCDVEL